MAIVAGFEVHRRQIVLDALDTETGEVSRGRIDVTAPAVDDVVTVIGRGDPRRHAAAVRALEGRCGAERRERAAVIAGRVQLPAGGRVGVTISGGNVGVDRFAALLGQQVRSCQRREGET